MHSNTIIVDMPSEAISLTDDGKSVGSALKKKKKKPLSVVKKLVIFEDPGNGFHENDRRQYKKEVILTRMIHFKDRFQNWSPSVDILSPPVVSLSPSVEKNDMPGMTFVDTGEGVIEAFVQINR